ncbi:MAG: competence protein CoiA family protein [Vagococcus sp.]|nr:competence protein CoiA family protein [Vagococcus sp.]
MFVARDEKGRLIEIWRLTQTEIKELKGNKFFCPVCQREMLLRQGQKTRAHFAHYEEGKCHVSKQAESIEHMTGKQLLAKWLSEASYLTVEIEKYYRRIQRQADLVVNQQLVVEYQCSPISIEQLIERTHDYQKIGLSVIWILGSPLFLKRKLKSLHVLTSYFSLAYQRHFFQLDVSQKELVLYHHLDTCADMKSVSAHKYVISERGRSLFDLLTASVSSNNSFELKPVTIESERLIHLIQQERQRLQRRLIYPSVSVKHLQTQLYNQKTHIMGLPPAFFWMRHHWLDNRMSSLSLLVAMKTSFYKQSFISHHHLVNQLDCLFQDYALDTGSARAKMSFSFYIHAILKMWESTGYMQQLSDGYRIEPKLHRCVSESNFNQQLRHEINDLSYYLMFPKH